MNQTVIYEELQSRVFTERVLRDEPMKDHTTFRIGGSADFFVTPSNIEEITSTVEFCREEGIPFYVIGNGSNLLVADAGFRGVIIQIGRGFGEVKQEGTQIEAQAGAMLMGISRTALSAGLTGLEFASGIPGTLGGAVRMNAGAYGGEMKDVVKSVCLIDAEGTIREIEGEKMGFGYRTSIAESGDLIILGSVLELQEGDPTAIAARMEELRQQRTSKQPLELPSAGSTFKRPDGYFAGKLIMDAGLRGFRVGGAQVSEKHCGFVVNTGNATAEDVRALMTAVQERVREQFGVSLEPEVRMIGAFPEEVERLA